jgi:hypothetical protein
MPAQTAVLSERPIAQDPTRHPRTRPRRCPLLANTEAFGQPRRERKKIEMRFAHLKRILKLGPAATAWSTRRPRRACPGCHCSEPTAVRIAGCATAHTGSVYCVAQTLRRERRGRKPNLAVSTEMADSHHRSQPTFTTKSAPEADPYRVAPVNFRTFVSADY